MAAIASSSSMAREKKRQKRHIWIRTVCLAVVIPNVALLRSGPPLIASYHYVKTNSKMAKKQFPSIPKKTVPWKRKQPSTNSASIPAYNCPGISVF